MVTASGCVLRMALTTVKPSPGLPMFRSDNKTSNLSEVIFCNASATDAAVVTSKPCFLSMAANVKRMASSSSTHNMRFCMKPRIPQFSRLASVRHTSSLLNRVGVGAAACVFDFAVGQGDGGGGVGWCGDGELVVVGGPVGGDEAVGGVVFGVEGGERGAELRLDREVMEAGA